MCHYRYTTLQVKDCLSFKLKNVSPYYCVHSYAEEMLRLSKKEINWKCFFFRFNVQDKSDKVFKLVFNSKRVVEV